MPDHMRALVCHSLTDDLSGLAIRNVPVPVPGEGMVRIKVNTASINFPDILMTEGNYQFKPDLPFSPGMDLAGTVDAVGPGTSVPIGTRVAGGHRFGAFAEYALAAESGLHALSETIDDAVAAAFPAAYLTAYVALVRRANLQPGETLLVHGASGGVGLAAVDVGKLLGATVIATSGSDSKLPVLKAYGADHVLGTYDGFRGAVKSLTNGRGADVIFDPVGGDVFDESTRCIAFDGRLLVIGFTSGRVAQLRTNIALIKGFSVLGVRAGEYGRQFPERGKENLAAIWKWAEDGKVRPRIHSELPLSEAITGLQMLKDRAVIGKVIIRPDRV